MCFSAQASFSAAVLLGASGTFNIFQAPAKIYWFLASIPLFFGLQQFFEGLLWVQLSSEAAHIKTIETLARAYLFFALVFWPVWIPFSIYVIEEIPMRKKILFLIFLAGCALAAINFYYAYPIDPNISMAQYSIRYYGNIPSEKFLYIGIVVLPAFISSFRNMWQFGLAVLLTAWLTDYFYESAFVSAWCFFAAIVSVVLLKIMKDNRRFQPLK